MYSSRQVLNASVLWDDLQHGRKVVEGKGAKSWSLSFRFCFVTDMELCGMFLRLPVYQR